MRGVKLAHEEECGTGLTGTDEVDVAATAEDLLFSYRYTPKPTRARKKRKARRARKIVPLPYESNESVERESECSVNTKLTFDVPSSAAPPSSSLAEDELEDPDDRPPPFFFLFRFPDELEEDPDEEELARRDLCR